MNGENEAACSAGVPVICQRNFDDLKVLIGEVKDIGQRLHQGDLRFVTVDQYNKKVNGHERRLGDLENWSIGWISGSLN